MNLQSLIPEEIWNLPATNVELSKSVLPLLVQTRKPIIFVYQAQPKSGKGCSWVFVLLLLLPEKLYINFVWVWRFLPWLMLSPSLYLILTLNILSRGLPDFPDLNNATKTRKDALCVRGHFSFLLVKVHEKSEGIAVEFRNHLSVRVFLKFPCSICAKQTFVCGSIWCKDSTLDYRINAKIKLINEP